MEDQMNPSKAAGSGDYVRQHHGHLVSASPSQPTYSRPLYSPYNDENDGFEASANQTSSRLQVSTSPPTAQPQASTRRMSSYTTPPRRSSKVSTASPIAQIPDDTASTSNSEWDLLDDQIQPTPTTPSSRPSSYDFPGTWPAALHDTSAALVSVGAATSSYATALTRSGIGKAGWSIGSALASTANKRALNLVDWAADRTGTGADALPKPMARWLKNGRQRMKDVRRAKERRESRDAVFGDERGAFVLETSLVSSNGEPVRGDGWEVADMKGGRRVFGEEDEEELPDGLVRLFEFDD